MFASKIVGLSSAVASKTAMTYTVAVRIFGSVKRTAGLISNHAKKTVMIIVSVKTPAVMTNA